MQLIPADFTDDEYERALLIHDEQPPDPNDPYHVEMHDIAVLLANFRGQLTALQKQAVPYLHQGLKYSEIAEKIDCSPQTVSRALQDPNVRQCLRLLQQADRLQHGPTMEQRTAMVWRIAARNEVDKPLVTLRALDVLNKQQGVYQPDDKTTSAPIINIREFKIEHHTHSPQNTPTREEREITDAEFTPARIEASPTE